MWMFDVHTGVPAPFDAKWFKAPVGALPMQVRHQYASANWQRGLPYPDQVGEVLGASRPWSNGAPVPGYNGIGHCGADGLWHGRLTSLAVAEPSHPDGSPLCCPLPPKECIACPGLIGPGAYQVVLNGGTGAFLGANGIWTLLWASPCGWLLDTPLGKHFGISIGFGFMELSYRHGADLVTWVIVGDPICFDPPLNWPVATVTGSGTPPTAQVTSL